MNDLKLTTITAKTEEELKIASKNGVNSFTIDIDGEEQQIFASSNKLKSILGNIKLTPEQIEKAYDTGIDINYTDDNVQLILRMKLSRKPADDK